MGKFSQQIGILNVSCTVLNATPLDSPNLIISSRSLIYWIKKVREMLVQGRVYLVSHVLVLICVVLVHSVVLSVLTGL